VLGDLVCLRVRVAARGIAPAVSASARGRAEDERRDEENADQRRRRKSGRSLTQATKRTSIHTGVRIP
jgi:hypothetical protein